jgi:uncharacterized BrkB/YihY/UPF0761 family membrane protein
MAKRLAIAYQIFTFMLVLFVGALAYIFTTPVVSGVASVTNQDYANAFNPVVKQWVSQIWTWLPLVVLIGAMVWLYMVAQKRNPSEMMGD